MKRIILDCTELYLNPVRTGVQRVVRELLNRWPSDGPELHVARFDGRGLSPLPPKAVRLLVEHDEDLAEWSVAQTREKLRTTQEIGSVSALPKDAPIFVPEVFYDSDRCQFYQEQVRETPRAIAFLLYDFIPLTHPQFFSFRSAASLMNYTRLLRGAQYSAFISEETRQEYLHRVLRQPDRPTGPVLALGCDGIAMEKQTWDSGRKSFLVVGSIEPRKRQELIVAAFTRMAAKTDAKLTLIGSATSDSDTTWLIDSPTAGLRWFRDASDARIANEMRSARATIFVSEAEGYGLPPVESLGVGIPVISTSDMPSLNSVPRLGQVRLDDVTIDSLADAMEAMMDDERAEKLWLEAETLKLDTWEDFTRKTVGWLAGLS